MSPYYEKPILCTSNVPDLFPLNLLTRSHPWKISPLSSLPLLAKEQEARFRNQLQHVRRCSIESAERISGRHATIDKRDSATGVATLSGPLSRGAGSDTYALRQAAIKSARPAKNGDHNATVSPTAISVSTFFRAKNEPRCPAALTNSNPRAAGQAADPWHPIIYSGLKMVSPAPEPLPFATLQKREQSHSAKTAGQVTPGSPSASLVATDAQSCPGSRGTSPNGKRPSKNNGRVGVAVPLVVFAGSGAQPAAAKAGRERAAKGFLRLCFCGSSAS